MTNLTGRQRGGVPLAQLLLWLPVVLCGLVALVLAGGWLWPALQRLQLAEGELDQLAEQRRRLPLLRAQLDKLNR